MPILVKLSLWQFAPPTLRKDGRWYWCYNSGLQAQNVIYRSKTSVLPDFSNEAQASAASEIFFDVQSLLRPLPYTTR